MLYLTGLQPSGKLHIGNYFGAIKPAIEAQDRAETHCLYFIADLHALTTFNSAAEIRDNTRSVALDFLACGLDPERTIFFRQSDVPETLELAWLLANVCPMGLLERSHSFKDKLARGISANAGLFTYPILMAADILLYGADLVPVGADQKQHLEITRDLAGKFNLAVGKEVLKVPAAEIREDLGKIPGIDGQKMSKSYENTLPIFDEPHLRKKRIMRIITDSAGVDESKDPEVSTIFQLYKFVATEAQVESMAEEFRGGGVGYGEFKKRLLDGTNAYFAKFEEKRRDLANKPRKIDEILREGAKNARRLARKTLEKAKRALGIRLLK